jgi:hypothetical protein
MDKYIGLLTTASGKASYRQRPIETLNKVQKLATKADEEKIARKKKQKAKYEESTPKRLAISEAAKKAGRKAFKEATKIDTTLNKLLYKKKRLELAGAPITEIEKVDEDIVKHLKAENKKADIEKEAEKYKDEPLKYLAKLTELKKESEAEEEDKTAKSIKELSKVLYATLTPSQRLEASEEYATLTPKEKKYINDILKQKTKYDVATRNTMVQSFLEATPTQRKALISGMLEGAEPYTEKVKKAVEVPDDKVIRKQKADMLARARLSPAERKYIKDKLYPDADAYDAETIAIAISKYRKEYEAMQPKKFDILFEEADKEEEEGSEALSHLAEAIDESGRLAAKEEVFDEDVPEVLIHPSDEVVRKDLAEQFIEEGLPADEAFADATQAVGATSKELNRSLLDEPVPPMYASETEIPVSLLVKDIEQMGDTGYKSYESKLTRDAIEHYLSKNPSASREEIYDAARDPKFAERLRLDYVNEAVPSLEEQEEEQEAPEIKIPSANGVQKFTLQEIQKFYTDNNIPMPKENPTLSDLRNNLNRMAGRKVPEVKQETGKRGRKKGSKNKPKGKGFPIKPLSSFPLHMVAGSLAKHIERVRGNRLKMKMTMRGNTENEEYRKSLKQHLLRGGSIFSFL